MPKPSARAMFASRLRAARTAAGWSQAELGTRVGIPEDVASTRVNRYERGVHAPDPDLAQKLADEVGLPLSSLYAGTEDLATLIAIFEQLAKKDRAAVLASAVELLGAKKAGALIAKVKGTPPADAVQGTNGRVKKPAVKKSAKAGRK